MTKALTISDLVCSIAGTQILNGVSFELEAGTTLGIIGPNGSGKTTLFNCISGFQRIESGQVALHGEALTHSSPHYRAKKGLGRVFQSSGVFREMSLIENLITALEAKEPLYRTILPFGRAARESRTQAQRTLEEIGLGARAKERASSLSGGQLRLLEIARTILSGADVVLLDEPTAGVSPKMKDEVARSILKLKALRKTTLVIEHDLAFIEKFCDRIVVLDVGKVVLEGDPQEIRASPQLKEIYFGGDRSVSR